MASHDLKSDNATHEEIHEQASAAVDSAIHHPKGWWSWQLVATMICIGCSMGLFGYDNSFAAPLISLPLFIAKYQGPAASFTARNLELIVPVPLVGAAIGVFAAAPLMERFGRKRAFLLAYFLCCTPGSFLQLFAPNLGALVFGRFWNYVGVSILTTTAPLYLSELVPAHFRGRAIGFCVAGTAAVGIIATTIVWATSKLTDDRQYKIPLAVQAAFPTMLGIGTIFCPESPFWEIQHERYEAARKTLLLLRNNREDIVEAELSMMQTTIRLDSERRANTHFWDIFALANLKRTLTSGALLCLNQVSGLILVSTYSTVILVQSGVGNPFQITIIITCLQFLGTVVGPVLVDRVGRRPVALFCFAILFILDIVAGSLAAAGLTNDSQRIGLATIFILFGFFNSASFQPLAFLLLTEVSTPALREPTVAWSLFWSYTTAIITTFAVPELTTADAGNLGAKAAFVFAGFVALTVVGTYFYIPETKARTLAEIDEMYAINLPMRKWRNYKCKVVSSTATELAGKKEES